MVEVANNMLSSLRLRLRLALASLIRFCLKPRNVNNYSCGPSSIPASF